MAHSSPVRKGVSFRHLVHAVVSWLVMALSVICGVLGTVAAFFGAAFLLDSSSVLFVAAFCVGFLITAGGAWIAARMMTWKRPVRIALSVGAATMLVLVLVTSLAILQPLPSTPAARNPPPVLSGVRYWNLNTGSHIAYLKVPAQGRTKATPIILVGGGPGEEDVADTSQTQFFGQLARDGYDVYFYDQIGSGLSARLADPGQYTLARHVADLEAIREQIGARAVILMGASWGGTLVATYMATYPEHVAKAIFTSPAPINEAEWSDEGQITSRLSAAAQQQYHQIFYTTPRFLTWYLLGLISPRTLLASNHTPTLILTGACNYIKWAVTWQYKTTLPNSTLLYFPQAGHVIYLDQPALYLASLRAFLLGTPLPLPPWTTARPPATLLGPAGE